MDVQINLDRRITLVSNVQTIDSSGGIVLTPTSKTIWANKSFTGGDGGQEYEEKGVIKGNTDTIFTIRYRTVTHKDHIEYQGKKYDIRRIEDVGRNNYLRLFANTDD